MDEPGFLLRAVTWHIGSGDALFTGFLLLLLGAILHVRRFRYSLAISILAIVWMLVADAVSIRGLMVWAIIGLFAVLWNRILPSQRQKSPRVQLFIVGIGTLFFAGFELLWHWPLHPVAPNAESIAIIGDSVSAGLNAKDVTWPRQLAQSTGRTIYDASQQGATVHSALAQLDKLDGRGELLWIEIGGNDILESLQVTVYAERLETLLQSAREKYRTIVMMEIPAPPGGGGYGIAQRELSKKYDIALVPKRQFLTVLTTAGSTQDGVHLANVGHQRMAALVQNTLGWTDGPQPGDYHRVD